MVATSRFAALAAALAVTVVAVAAQCSTPQYGSCGSNAGTTCCPSGQYCQPWDAGFFQCINPPAKCSQQFTNIDFYGNDLKTVNGVQPAACCDECAKTPGCTSYTFINSAPGSPACYLKSGSAGDRRPLVGAVSGLVNGGSTVAPTVAPTVTPTVAPTTTPTSAPTPPSNSCSTPLDGGCGSNAGTTCCPTGQYCQPWNDSYFQCIQPPAKCSQQLTNTDFYGNDLKTVYVSQPSLCCDACAQTPGCKAYTYINNNPGQPVCYLKSAAGTPTALIGAVAGRLN